MEQKGTIRKHAAASNLAKSSPIVDRTRCPLQAGTHEPALVMHEPNCPIFFWEQQAVSAFIIITLL